MPSQTSSLILFARFERKMKSHPREGLEPEFMLDQRRQADGAFPEVDRLCRHHHLERPWRDDHSDRLTAASTRAI